MIKQLASQTALYGVSSIASRLLNYLLTPLLTRVLTTGEYGVITDLYALIPFLLVIGTMGLETAYFRFAGAATSEAERRTLFATTWGTVSAIGLLLAAGVMLFLNPLSAVMAYSDHPSYVAMMGWIVALDLITTMPYARLRQEQRAGRFVAIRTASVVLNVLLVVLLYVGLPRWAPSLYDPAFAPGYYLLANLIASGVTLLLLFPTYRDTLPIPRLGVLRRLLAYALPLVAGGTLGIANLYIDRQMIKYLMPAEGAFEALGIYGAIAKLGVILLLFTQMYRYAAEPFFLGRFDKNAFKQLNAEAFKYFALVAIGIFLFIIAYEPLFALLVRPDFRQSISILTLIIIANIFTGLTLNLNFWYKQSGQTHFALWVVGVGLACTLGLNLLLVPRLGYVGAAWARLGCELVMFAVSYALNRRYYPTPYNLPRVGSYALFGALAFGAMHYTATLPTALFYLLNTLLLGGYAAYGLWREGALKTALIQKLFNRT